jgi:ABC-2 type transport system permease protein
VPLIFGLVVIPITFLGATYYPWASLSSLPWLQTIVLVNPLVYMSEGMRVSLTPWVTHMPLWGIYGGMLLFTALLGAWGIQGFSKRVLS